MQVLNITFRSFHLELSTGCMYDFLQLNDGPNAGARVIGRYCGTTPPGVNGSFLTTHNSIYFWFRSDHSVARDGFEAFWNTTDPGKSFYAVLLINQTIGRCFSSTLVILHNSKQFNGIVFAFFSLWFWDCVTT